MNIGNGHNVFNDIPGFDASKGERIVKALQRLWSKIEYLEQIRISEKKSRSKEVGTSSNDEDLTITDVQYKLLLLQIQYARSIVRKKLNEHLTISPKRTVESNEISKERNENNQNSIELHGYSDFKNMAVCQETQTGNSLAESVSSDAETSDAERNKERIHAQISTDSQVFQYEDPAQHSASVSYKTLAASSRPHYRLNLNNMPFLLAASTSASHSVFANAQNIIAMMKSHNKALCGPKHVQRPSHPGNIQATTADSQDVTKMFSELAQDLSNLGLKQKELAKKLDAAQGKDHVASKIFANEDKGRVNKIGEGDLLPSKGPRRFRSNFESTKLHAEVKNASKTKERDIVKYNAQQKQNLSHARNQTNSLSVMDRRQLLRSLQNFKMHLSEEDITWE